MTAPDISREAVSELQKWLASLAGFYATVPPSFVDNKWAQMLRDEMLEKAAASVHAFGALRDALDAAEARIARAEAALAEHGGRYWEARYRDEAAALPAAAAAEREACARVADAFATAHGEAIAKSIRARGEVGVDALAAAVAAEREACAVLVAGRIDGLARRSELVAAIRARGEAGT